MDISFQSTIAKGPTTKTDLINQAHEARLARELARRQDKAATIIQANLKGYAVKRRLKKDAMRRFEELNEKSTFSMKDNIQLVLRQLLMLCDPTKDRTTLESVLRFILIRSASEDNQKNDIAIPRQSEHLHDDPSTKSTEAKDPDYTIELSAQHLRSNDQTLDPSQYRSFIALVVSESSQNDEIFECWLKILERISNICLIYLREASTPKIDSQRLELYLRLINLLTSSKLLGELVDGHIVPKYSLMNEDLSATISKISTELLSKTIYRRRSFFMRVVTSSIAEKLDAGFRSDLKASILENFIQISLKLIQSEETSDDMSPLTIKSESSVSVLIRMLSLPGLICNLRNHCPATLKELNDHSILLLSIKTLKSEQHFQKLTSAASICMLANLVHLAQLNEEVLRSKTIPFVVLITKILQSCQKSMLHVPSAIKNGTPRLEMNNARARKKESNQPAESSFNPILGWLASKQDIKIDRDIIKSQLSNLWSKKFLSILLQDLTNVNEKLTKQGSNRNQSHTSRAPIDLHNADCRSDCDDRPKSLHSVLWRRVVDKTSSTMVKTIKSSYSRTSGLSGSTGSTKLMTDEATKIALVCHMLHTTLKTLTTLKQDILTGFCLNDFILPNLWNFISSLGPQNGLRAFLEHLAIHTKTDRPEFHILALFCECASHLISILDDSELYERQRPFTLDNLVEISAFLNTFVFRVISNNLITYNAQDVDPLLHATHKLLANLYKRDCRRKFAPQDHWLIKEVKVSAFLRDLELAKPYAKAMLALLPHIIPHRERVLIFRKLVAKDKARHCSGFSTFITIHRSRVVEDGYQQLAKLNPKALKGLIRVKFINDHGLDEAGIDQDGVFKEFLEDTIKRVFDPALNLFCITSEHRLYPSPTSRMHEDYLSLFNFVGKMLAKAIYEGIVVDVPFASFFLSRVLGQPQSPLYSPIDELPSLDPELYKSLTYIKHYEGDVSELDLTFSIDQDFMGKIETHELELGGKSIPVTRESRVRYIHSVANFRMRTQIEKQTEAFLKGFKEIINIEWLSIFSASEFQRLISGDTSPIDIQDLRRHTKYFGGFHNNHRVICWLWDVLERDFTTEEHRLFLKFITSCSKPPLLGFANLEPPFSIRCVEVSDDQDSGDTVGSVLRGFFAIRRSDPVDRLPTSSTCFNLLKLPNYQRRSTLREKLRYAIRSNPGFELS